MAYFKRFRKHPLETKSYDFPFASLLADFPTDDIDTIAVEEDSGIGIADGSGDADAPAVLAGTQTVRIFVYAGVDGFAYDVAVVATTNEGRVLRQTALFVIAGTGAADAPPSDGGEVDTEYVNPPVDEGEI